MYSNWCFGEQNPHGVTIGVTIHDLKVNLKVKFETLKLSYVILKSPLNLISVLDFKE